MVLKAVLLLLGAGLAMTVPINPPRYIPLEEKTIYGDPYKPKDHDPYKPKDHDYKHVKRPYKFDYGVRDDYTGANFGHTEDSDGNSIKGSYTVALPDGRIQTVTYVADHHNGFQAKVTYEGEAKYSKPAKHHDSYGAPEPHPYKSASLPHHHQPQYKSEPSNEVQYLPQPVGPQYKSEPSNEPQYLPHPVRAQYRTREEPKYSPVETNEAPRFSIPDIGTFQPLDLISLTHDENLNVQQQEDEQHIEE